MRNNPFFWGRKGGKKKRNPPLADSFYGYMLQSGNNLRQGHRMMLLPVFEDVIILRKNAPGGKARRLPQWPCRDGRRRR